MEFVAILQNKPIWAAILAWAIAQIIKTILSFVKNDKLDLSRFYGSGGMPSSHSSLVMALAFSVGKYYGFDGPSFAIGIIVAFVVMYDAAGGRRAAGKQAALLNILIHRQGITPQEQLKELLGHTPLEVIAGAILGTVTGLLF